MLKKADLFKTVIPTKMLEFMSCGRPVILAVDGQAREILEESRGGVFTDPEDARGLVRRFRSSPPIRTCGQRWVRMGANIFCAASPGSRRPLLTCEILKSLLARMTDER